MLPTLVLALAAVAPSPQEQDPARLLPADTLVYFGTNSVRAGREATQKTAMSKILGEAEVRAFLQEPLSAANRVLEVLIGQAQGQMDAVKEQMKQLAPDSAEAAELMAFDKDFLDPSKSMGPPPLGQVFMALTHVDLPTGPDTPLDIGLVVGVELLDADHIGLLKSLWSGVPFPEEKATHGSVEYMRKMMPEMGMAVSLAVHGNLAVISTSESTLHQVLGRLQDLEELGPSLAAAADYRAMLSTAGGLTAGGSSHIVRFGKIYSGLIKPSLPIAMASMPDESGISPEEMQQLLSIIDDIGLEAFRMVGGTSKIAADGMIHSTSVASVDTDVGGLIGEMMGGAIPLDAMVTQQIPADSLSATAMTIGNDITSVYDFIMNAIAKVEPAAIEQIEADIAKMFGESDLREDVLANVRGPAYWFRLPGQGLMGTPDTYGHVSMRDPGAFADALGNLISSVAAQFGMPVKLKRSEHEGKTLCELDLSQTPAAAAMIQPSFALGDGEIVFGTTVRSLKSYLNGAVDGDPLSEDADFRKFVEELDTRGDLQQLSYSDNAATFSTTYGTLVGMSSLMAAAMGDIPVDLAKLPTDNAIAQHLEPTFSGAYVTDDGMVVSRAISQFQVSDFVPLFLIGGLVAFGMQEGIGTEVVAEVEVDPAEQAQDDLRELKASITVYKIAQGGYPESLKDLLRPLDDYPEGAYPHEAIPADPWNNPYYFAMETHPRKKRLLPKLWSAGPNGVDENGEGDDILKF